MPSKKKVHMEGNLPFLFYPPPPSPNEVWSAFLCQHEEYSQCNSTGIYIHTSSLEVIIFKDIYFIMVAILRGWVDGTNKCPMNCPAEV